MNCRTAVVAACAILTAQGCSSEPGPRLDLPDRPASAPQGSEVVAGIEGLELDAREERLVAEIETGNVPAWLRDLRRVEMTVGSGEAVHDVVFWVTPDYLAVGSDEDYVLVPVSASVARRLADGLGGILPTPAMVDAIWAAADDRLTPIRLAPGREMNTVDYFDRHDKLVKSQRAIYDTPVGSFVAGHKVDVVTAPGSLADRDGVAIYGWHLRDGQVVQPLFIGETDRLVAFSHGVRVVHRTALMDGASIDLRDLLNDPAIAPSLFGSGAAPAHPARGQDPPATEEPD